MNIIEKKNKYNQLFDYYGCLLTTKQQEYFVSYYFEDLSLSEIANIYNISRNAVYDQLKKIYDLLDYYEDKLKLVSKNNEYDMVLNQYSNSLSEETKELINKLRSLE